MVDVTGSGSAVIASPVSFKGMAALSWGLSKSGMSRDVEFSARQLMSNRY